MTARVLFLGLVAALCLTPTIVHCASSGASPPAGRVSTFLEAGLALDYTHGSEDDPYGFVPKDFRNDPKGMAAGCGIEVEAPVSRWMRPFYGNPARAWIRVSAEYYPNPAGSRLVQNAGVNSGVPTRQEGAGNKLLLAAALGMARVFGGSQQRVRPFVEFGLGYASARGDAYEDRNAVTNELLTRTRANANTGVFGELGTGIRVRRSATREWMFTLRTQGYTNFATGGNSVEFLVGTLFHGPYTP